MKDAVCVDLGKCILYYVYIIHLKIYIFNDTNCKPICKPI